MFWVKFAHFFSLNLKCVKSVNLNNGHSLWEKFKVDLKDQLRSIRQWCLDVLNCKKQMGAVGLTIIRDMTEVS